MAWQMLTELMLQTACVQLQEWQSCAIMCVHVARVKS